MTLRIVTRTAGPSSEDEERTRLTLGSWRLIGGGRQVIHGRLTLHIGPGAAKSSHLMTDITHRPILTENCAFLAAQRTSRGAQTGPFCRRSFCQNAVSQREFTDSPIAKGHPNRAAQGPLPWADPARASVHD